MVIGSRVFIPACGSLFFSIDVYVSLLCDWRKLIPALSSITRNLKFYTLLIDGYFGVVGVVFLFFCSSVFFPLAVASRV